MSNPAPVRPSPEGVPGAVTDPASVLGEDVSFAGAEGALINGYLASPVASSGEPKRPAIIVIHEAGGLGAGVERLFAMVDASVLADLEGAADFLRARQDVNGKVGCVGFCVGGRGT